MRFEKISLSHAPVIWQYMSRWGENSCQHAFASMFCLYNKYADAICREAGFLFVCRQGKCGNGFRVYLGPMGEGDLKEAVALLQQDAHTHGARLRFETVTKAMRDKITAAFPGMFEVQQRRDLAEYLYTRETLAELSGPKMASKRHDVSAFWRNYAGRVTIETIGEDNLEQVRLLQEAWLRENLCEEDAQSLMLEDEAIRTALDHFFALGMSGILLYVDGIAKGYACGGALSDTTYDVMYEKGDRRVADIYRILNMELVRRCCDGFLYINREEDLGIEGLRKSKLSYKPECLIEKYSLTEVRVD